jgi:hypothetical protein
MESRKYIGMDVHQASISAAVRGDAGKLVMECVIETNAPSWNSFKDCMGAYASRLRKVPVRRLYDLVKPHVAQVVVCDPRKNALLKAGNKNDQCLNRDL